MSQLSFITRPGWGFQRLSTEHGSGTYGEVSMTNRRQ